MGCEHSVAGKNGKEDMTLRKEKRKMQKVHGRVSGVINTFQNVTKQDNSLSKNDRQEISKIVSRHFYLCGFSDHQKSELIGMMNQYTCLKNEYVFKQGSPGSLFFIIKSGKVAIQINHKLIKYQNKGEYFGDFSLLYTAPRSASVRAVDNCVFWCLHQQHLKIFIKQYTERNYKIAKPLIEKTPLFQFMTKKQINSLSYCANEEKYEPNQIIFKEGDDANACYIIKQGEVNIKIPNKDQITIKSGEMFGENSFKANQRRAGTAKVGNSSTTLVSISREGLIQALGGSKLSQITDFNILRWALLRSRIFQNISVSLIKNIMQIAEIQEFSDNQIIIKKKELIKYFLVPIEGMINGFDVGNLINEEYFLEACKFGKNGRENLGMENEKKFECKENLKKKGQGRVFLLRIENVEKVLGFNILARLSEKQLLFKNQQFLQNKTKTSLQDKQCITVIMNKRNKSITEVNLQNLIYLTKLGQGQFGKVFLVKNQDNVKLALKCIKKKQIIEYEMEDLAINEKEVLSEIEHPMIVKYFNSSKDQSFLYFLLEYIEGCDFFDALREIGICNQSTGKFYLGCLILAIEELHSRNIIYRDLKPENAVVDSKGYIRLIDMGATKKLTEENGFRTFTVIGTPHYMAPEVIDGKGYSFEADIWSLGILFYEMVCGVLPFGENEEDSYRIYKKIVKQKRVRFPKFYTNQAGRKLIERLIDFNPSRRSVQDFQTLKNDPYFAGQNWQDLYNKLIETPYKPSKKKLKNDSKKITMAEYLKDEIKRNKVHQEQTPWDKYF